MSDSSAALFRAANLRIMDYPFEAALTSALSVCDEAVVVVGQSEDDTHQRVCDAAQRHAGRVIVAETVFHYDLMWQEKWWDLASSLTDAEWLMYHDADEVLHEDDARAVRAAMSVPCIALISLGFVHFYMTPNWTRNFPARATRLGRRSAGFRMRNWRSERMPGAPACQMVYGPDEVDAHNPGWPDVAVLDAPLYHYSWCRDAVALQISQMKHVDWYWDGQRFNLLDGRVPDAGPFDFLITMPELLRTEQVQPYAGTHPEAIHPWLAAHEVQWATLEAQWRQLA